MEALLKVRLDLKINDLLTDPVRFQLDENNLLDNIKSYNMHSEHPPERISNLLLDASILSPVDFYANDIDIDNITKKIILDSYERIALIKLELGLSHKNDPVIREFKSFLPIENVAITVARHMLLQHGKVIEILVIKDYYKKTERMIISPNPTTMSIGAKYRLLLDNVIIAERFFPYDLPQDKILEENVYVDILFGTHTLKVETLSKNTVFITDVAIEGQITREINANTCSFEFH